MITTLPGRELKCTCRVSDFSRSGLGLTCESLFPIRSAVLVEMDGCILTGEVCYCNEHNGAFRIGLQLDQFLTVPENPALPVRHIAKEMAN